MKLEDIDKRYHSKGFERFRKQHLEAQNMVSLYSLGTLAAIQSILFQTLLGSVYIVSASFIPYML